MTVSRASLFVSLLVAGLAVSPSAFADVVIPLNDPPTVANLKLPTALQPASPRSTETYKVVATVGSQGTVANLKSVTMCWFKGTASPTCDDAKTSPETQFEMIWSQATNSFSISGTNNYLNAGSTTTYGDGSGLTMDVTFSFKVSSAMLAGEDWAVRVVAVDQQDQGTEQDPVFSSELEATGLPVLFFGAVTTQPAAKSFGELKLGEDKVVSNVSTGVFRANGVADLSISASDFSYGSSVIPLATTTPAPSGKVALECNSGASFAAAQSFVVTATPSTLLTGQFASGTGESTATTVPHSCRLSYGGGTTVANVEYSNTVTVAIRQGLED